MSCQQVPTAPAFNPYPRSVQVGEFEVAIGGGIWVAIGAAMLRMLCEQLGIHANTTAIGSLKALYQNADRTLANHRAWVREKLGLAAYDTSAEERLRAALSQQAI